MLNTVALMEFKKAISKKWVLIPLDKGFAISVQHKANRLLDKEIFAFLETVEQSDKTNWDCHLYVFNSSSKAVRQSLIQIVLKMDLEMTCTMLQEKYDRIHFYAETKLGERVLNKFNAD